MSTLTGNKISLTYKSLFKTADNDVLTATLKQMSDGLGNNSGVYLNTGGDLKTTGILEFANFKGTSTAVTINKLVNEADGISNNDNDTSLPTSAAVKDYVDTHVTSQDLDFKGDSGTGAVDLDSQLLDIAGTTNEIVTSASAQKLTIGLPNSVTISGTYTGATFSGDLNGTINTATSATTQSAGTSNQTVATTKFVMDLDSASDLDFSGTTGTGDVNLNTQTFAVSGTANQITTAASNQGLQISLLSTGVTMPNGSVATTQSAGDNSTKLATTAYVDVLDSASDLDITDGTNTSDVNLNTQSLSILGTANEIVSTVSAQTATISLPSTINVNVTGNVTGNLTGNADTATKWQTARNLSLSGEATGTIASVDGSVAVSGAVTLTNSAVVAKVLTGLPTPAAGNIVATDTILNAFGKLQSQISTISSGLVFKGSWDADTNTPALVSGGGEVDSGTTTSQATNRLIQTGQNFNTTVSVGNKVINQTDGTTALVTVIASNTELVLDADIMLNNEAYTIDASPFISQGEYYVVNVAGTTNLNGITDWAIGDWVIADADNRWSKLDHSQIDGGGSLNSLPVFTSSNTIGDSIVAQAGTALTITGSATTTLGLSSTGNFAVNTNKFTANATTGNTAFSGDLAINTNKFTVNATSGNTLVAGTLNSGAITSTGNVTLTSTAPLLYLNNTTTSTGKNWRLSSATNGKFFITQEGVIDAVTLDPTTGNATFAGSITSTGLSVNAGTYHKVIASFPSTYVTNLQIGQQFNLNNDALTDTVTFAHTGTEAASDFIFTIGGNQKLKIQGNGNSTFAGSISTVGASTFNLGEGIFTKAVNTSNAVASSNVWGYGLYEGVSRIAEFSMVRDGSSSVYVGTSFAGQKLILGTAAKVPALTIDVSQNSTFAGIITANSSSSGDYVRMYGSSGTGKWDIYGNGANLRISDNESAGILAVDTGATFGGNVIIGDTTGTSPNSADRFLKIGKSNLQDCSIILQDAVETWEIYQNDDLQFSFGTTPTTVMTMQRTTGNVGIGINPIAKFQVNLTTDVNFTTTNSGAALRLNAVNNATTAAIPMELNASYYNFLGSGLFYLSGAISSSAGATFGGNLKLTASGSATYFSLKGYLGDSFNFGTGETTDGVSYTINGAQAGTNGNYFRWLTQEGAATPTEKMRITSGGDVQITGTYPVFSVTGTGSVGSTFKILSSQDGIGRTIIGTAGQTRAMYFENDGKTVHTEQSYFDKGAYLGGSVAANLLDDYEEGTFTATTNNDGVGLQVTARYTKIGQLVTYTIYIPNWSPTAAGNAIIAGFPFTAITSNGYGVGNVTHSTAVLNCSGGYNSTTNWVGTLNNSTSPATWVVASARSIMVTGFYYTTA